MNITIPEPLAWLIYGSASVFCFVITVTILMTLIDRRRGK